MIEGVHPMLLHDLKSGMHPRRVRILLAEKGVEIPSRQVDVVAGENTSAEFRRLNPLGKVPVLVLDDGSVLSESMAICRYLEALYPTPPLFGSTDLQKARIEMWLRRAEYEIARPVVDIFVHSSDFYRTRLEQVPAYAAWARQRLDEGMAWLDRELAGTACIGQDDYSMADIVAQCALVLGKAVGIRVADEHANLARWFAAVSARPSARA